MKETTLIVLLAASANHRQRFAVTVRFRFRNAGMASVSLDRMPRMLRLVRSITSCRKDYGVDGR